MASAAARISYFYKNGSVVDEETSFQLVRQDGLLKIALGVLLLLSGGAILSGFDKALETALVNASPEWLTALTTQF